MMRLLSLDYRDKGTAAAKAGWVLLLAGIAVAAAVGYHYQYLDRQLVQGAAKVSEMERLSHHRAGKQADDTPEMKQEVQRANEVLQQLTIPWNALFQAVESSSDEQVALLAVQPDAHKHILRISGEAKNYAALLDYIKRLEQGGVLTQVFLLSHEIRQDDRDHPVRFALTANWTAPL